MKGSVVMLATKAQQEKKGIAPYKSYDFCYVLLTTAPILYCIVVTIMYCIIFHTMLYIPVLLLLNKHSFIHSKQNLMRRYHEHGLLRKHGWWR